MSLRGFRRERFGGDGAGEALVAAAGAERLAANAGALPTSHENNEKLVAAGHGYSVPLRRQRVPLFLPSHTLHVAPRWSPSPSRFPPRESLASGQDKHNSAPSREITGSPDWAQA